MFGMVAVRVKVASRNTIRTPGERRLDQARRQIDAVTIDEAKRSGDEHTGVFTLKQSPKAPTR